MKLSPEKQSLLERIVALLSAIPGVEALALGGSHARGTQRPDSDLDVGLYYHEAAPFDLNAVRRAAEEIAGGTPVDVTDFYGWGAWVNGGAWIHTPAGKVDFIYRNIEQVQRTIDEAKRGVTHHDFDQQPAYGFYSVTYLGETHVNAPLYDPHGVLADLKAQVAVYPPALTEKTLAGNLWMAEFSLLHAEGFARAGNVYTTAGALTRAASFVTQALFALNETYFITDKTALKEIAAFPIAPGGYAERLARVLGALGESPGDLERAVQKMRALWSEVVDLSGGYTPAFRV